MKKLEYPFVEKAVRQLRAGDVVAGFDAIAIAHDSVDNAAAGKQKMPGWGEAFRGLWHSTGICDIIRQSRSDFKKTWTLGLGRVLMMCVALLLIYLAIDRKSVV